MSKLSDLFDELMRDKPEREQEQLRRRYQTAQMEWIKEIISLYHKHQGQPEAAIEQACMDLQLVGGDETGGVT